MPLDWVMLFLVRRGKGPKRPLCATSASEGWRARRGVSLRRASRCAPARIVTRDAARLKSCPLNSASGCDPFSRWPKRGDRRTKANDSSATKMSGRRRPRLRRPLQSLSGTRSRRTAAQRQSAGASALASATAGSDAPRTLTSPGRPPREVPRRTNKLLRGNVEPPRNLALCWLAAQNCVIWTILRALGSRNR